MAKTRTSKRHYGKSSRRLATEHLARLVRVVEQEPTAQESAAILMELLKTWGKTIFSTIAQKGLGHFVEHDITAWRIGVRRLLRSLLPLPKEGRMLPEAELTLKFTAAPIAFGGWWMNVDGEPADVLYFRVLDLCQRAGPEALKECDCGKLFVKTGRRKFCSTKCQKRIQRRAERKTAREERMRRKHGKTTRTR